MPCKCEALDTDEEFPCNQQGDEDLYPVGASQDGVIDLTQDSVATTQPLSQEVIDLADTDGEDDEEEEKEVSDPKRHKSGKEDFRGSDWIWVINNPTAKEIKAIKKLLMAECAYGVFQGERGKNGTPHLQGFLQFKDKKRFKTVKNLFKDYDLNKVHLEPRRGSVKEADDYARKADSKDDSIHPLFFCGKINLKDKQGKRNDMVEVFSMLKSGKDRLEIAEAFPGQYLRYRSNILATKEDLAQNKERQGHRLIIFFGSSGSGKSYKARQWLERDQRDGESYVEVARDLSDYGDRGCPRLVLIEEFKGTIPFSDFKAIFDSGNKHPALRQRYRNVTYLAECTIITSNHHPATWYDLNEVEKKAFYRRISECYEFKGEWGNPDDPVVTHAHGCGEMGLPSWFKNAESAFS